MHLKVSAFNLHLKCILYGFNIEGGRSGVIGGERVGNGSWRLRGKRAFDLLLWVTARILQVAGTFEELS